MKTLIDLLELTAAALDAGDTEKAVKLLRAAEAIAPSLALAKKIEKITEEAEIGSVEKAEILLDSLLYDLQETKEKHTPLGASCPSCPSPQKSLVQIIAAGLDAAGEGRAGLTEEHAAAMSLANAAPDLLAALKLLVDGHSMKNEAIGREAIAKAGPLKIGNCPAPFKPSCPLALPCTLDRDGLAGKVFLLDDDGEWVADVHAKKADDLLRMVNAFPVLLSAAQNFQNHLSKMENGKWLNSAPGEDFESAIARAKGGAL